MSYAVDTSPTNNPEFPFELRSFRSSDQAACEKLYREGVLDGAPRPENDTGVDIDVIDLAYMKDPGSHFWVAQTPAVSDGKPGEIVGMIGVQQHDEGVGQIRRLRVRNDMRRRGIGTRLVEAALRFCHEKG